MTNSRQGRIPSELGWLVDELDEMKARLHTLEAPSGEALASTTAKTAANIEELLTRAITTSESAYTHVVNLGDPIPYESGAQIPIDFTLTERRKVYFRTSVYVGMSIVHGTSYAGADLYALARFRIDLTDNATSEVTSTTTPVQLGAAANAGLRAAASSAARYFLDDYRILNPGDYTVTFSAAVEELTAGDALVRIQNPRLAVQIMEKDG